MCQYCGETFQDSTREPMFEGHYPRIENIPIHLIYLIKEVDSEINKRKKLHFLEQLNVLIEEFNLTPDTKLAFIDKENLKRRLEILIETLRSENMCSWESITCEYFSKGEVTSVDNYGSL